MIFLKYRLFILYTDAAIHPTYKSIVQGFLSSRKCTLSWFESGIAHLLIRTMEYANKVYIVMLTKRVFYFFHTEHLKVMLYSNELQDFRELGSSWICIWIQCWSLSLYITSKDTVNHVCCYAIAIKDFFLWYIRLIFCNNLLLSFVLKRATGVSKMASHRQSQLKRKN